MEAGREGGWVGGREGGRTRWREGGREREEEMEGGREGERKRESERKRGGASTRLSRDGGLQPSPAEFFGKGLRRRVTNIQHENAAGPIEELLQEARSSGPFRSCLRPIPYSTCPSFE